MANIFLFANLARSSLAGGITNVSTSLTVQSGGGPQFPEPTVGQQFAMTLTDAATGLLKEIVYCTARPGDGDTMTVVRGQEGYTPLNWIAGDPIANLWTAGQAGAMVQQGQQQGQLQNYAVDSGSVNAYVGIYSPAIVAAVPGTPLRLKIANTNTGPSTFNPGSGIGNIVNGANSALAAGELKGGLIYEFQWNGAAYEIIGPSGQSIPTGSIFPYAFSTPPAGGWLMCSGQSVLRASFPALNTLMANDAYPYGTADGTHFNVPDLRGRVPAMIDGAASRLTGATMTPNGDDLGATGGNEHTVVPTLTVTGTADGTVTGNTGDSTSGSIGAGGSGTNVTLDPHDHPVAIPVSLPLTASAAGVSIASIQPTLLVNYIIKT